MVTVLAQSVPGEQWIPVALAITAIGLILGLAGIGIRGFGGRRTLGITFGIVAVAIGALAPIVFYIIPGTDFVAIAYLIFATPLVPGVVAVAIHRKARGQQQGFEVLAQRYDD